MVQVDTLAPAPGEFQQRAKALAALLREQRASAAVLFDPHRVMYYSGFAFYPTERPVAAILTQEAEVFLFLPELEREHAMATSAAQGFKSYIEYPGDRHPMLVLADYLAEQGLHGKLAADLDGYPLIYGYQGPTLSDVTQQEVRRVAAEIDHLMSIKSDYEVSLVRESMRWANLGHTLLQRYTRVGASEMDVSQRAGFEATQAMRAALGLNHRANSLGFFGDGVLATYRGQVGRRSSLPHATTVDAHFAAGDTLVTGATAPVWGYYSDLERTMFVGEPQQEQIDFFNHMLNLQNLVFDLIRPGITAAEVDQATLNYYETEKLTPYWRHHTGHGLGSRNHEWLFLDRGNSAPLEVGMILSVEPGLYHPDWGGFRHSDTVLVTASGCQRLSYYPRNLEALIIPA